MHGIRKITEDTAFSFYESEFGIKVVPHGEQWSGYYRIGEGQGKWTLILTAFCHGKCPGVVTISIRAWEDLQSFAETPRTPYAPIVG